MFKSSILLLLILNSFILAREKTLNADLYTKKNGLSQVTIYSINQDKLGFIWIVTQDGLNRFDGYDFTVYKHKPNDSTSIPINFCSGVLNDSQNRLWFTSGNEFLRYNFDKNNFIQYPNNIGIRGFGQIVEDNSGFFWSATNLGIASFNPLTGKFKAYPDTSSKKDFNNNNVIECLTFDNENTIYYGDHNGNLKSLNLITKHMKVLKNFSSRNIRIISDVVYKDSILWLGTFHSGIISYDLTNRQTNHYNISKGNLVNNTINKLYIDKKGNLYSATNGYFCKYDSANDKFESIRIEIPDKKVPPDYNVSEIFQDRDGNFWLGLDPVGLVKISKKKNLFHTISNDPSSNPILPSNVVMSMLQDRKKNLWFGTWGGGLVMFSKKQNKSTIFKNNPNNNNSLTSNNVSTLCEDSEGNIWAGSLYNGLSKFIPDKNRFIQYPSYKSKETSYPQKFIINIVKDDDQNIWIGNVGDGLYEYDFAAKSFSYVSLKIKNKVFKQRLHISTMCKDTVNNIWIGTKANGICKFDPKSRSFTFFDNKKDSSQALYYGEIRNIYQDSRNRLWAASSEDLYQYSYKKNLFIKYKQAKEICSHVVNAMLDDDKGNLWISTNDGIYNIEFKRNLIKRYNENDGLLSNEYVNNSALKSEDGILYFAGLNGITYFNPDRLSDKVNAPRVYITGLSVLNHKVKPSADSPMKKYIISAKKIILKHTDYFFQLEFTAIDYDNNKDLKYAYKMDGFNKDWIITNSTRRFATFTNLDAGSYTFRVTTIQNGKPSIANEAAISVVISPAFWQTWWFYSIIILIVIFILYSFYRFRINRLLELERLRIKIASDLHDDIGANLTKLALKVDVIKQDVNEEKASELSRVSEMSREAISTMRDIVWSIDSRNDKFENLLNKMKDFAFSVLREKGVIVNFSVDGFHAAQKLPIEIRQNLYLILKESVNNISRHSNTEKVDIILNSDGKNYLMIIKDYGNNFTDKEFKVGQGLKNIKMRAGKINAEVSIKNSEGFEIIIKGNLGV